MMASFHYSLARLRMRARTCAKVPNHQCFRLNRRGEITGREQPFTPAKLRVFNDLFYHFSIIPQVAVAIPAVRRPS